MAILQLEFLETRRIHETPRRGEHNVAVAWRPGFAFVWPLFFVPVFLLFFFLGPKAA